MRFVIEAVGLKSGGGKALAIDLLSRLRRFRDHEFVLFVPDMVEYQRLKGPGIECIPYRGPSGLLARYWALHRTLLRICTKYRADALLCLGNILPKRSPCPAVVLIQNAYLMWHERVAEQRLTLREKLILAYSRSALRHITDSVHVVVQTAVMRDRIASMLSLDLEKISVIPAPSDSSSYTLSRPLQRDHVPFTLICVAGYCAHKNLEILIEALKQIPKYEPRPCKCLITISPDQHPGARKLLRRIEQGNLGHCLVNIGPVPRERLAALYGSADALILPTLLESHTRTYSEAMHYGLPILTSDRDFARFLCKDAALYFDPLDPDSVAKSIAKIMANPDLRETLVRNGRRLIIENPGWDEIARRFVTVLENAALEHAAADPQNAHCAPVLG